MANPITKKNPVTIYNNIKRLTAAATKILKGTPPPLVGKVGQYPKSLRKIRTEGDRGASAKNVRPSGSATPSTPAVKKIPKNPDDGMKDYAERVLEINQRSQNARNYLDKIAAKKNKNSLYDRAQKAAGTVGRYITKGEKPWRDTAVNEILENFVKGTLIKNTYDSIDKGRAGAEEKEAKSLLMGKRDLLNKFIQKRMQDLQETRDKGYQK